MKKEQRLVFLELSSEVDTLLCTFCKYEEGGCGDSGCQHPLEYRLSSAFGMNEGPEPGDDCWGFRPALGVSDCADIVGIILQNGWQRWWWGNNKKEIYKYQVIGIEEAK